MSRRLEQIGRCGLNSRHCRMSLHPPEGHDVSSILKDASQPSAGPLHRISECLSSTRRFLSDQACRGFAALTTDAAADTIDSSFEMWLSLEAVENAHSALNAFFTAARSAVAGLFFRLLLLQLRSLLLGVGRGCFALLLLQPQLC